MSTGTKRVSVQVNGHWIRDMLVMEARYGGFDPLAKKRFPAGAMIAFKRLHPDEQQTIYGDGRHFESIAILWDTDADAPVSHHAEITGKSSLKKDFIPSEYQKAILETLLNTDDHIEIKAYAGSGKTATLVWLVQELFVRKLLPRRVVFLAYNKNIEEELNVRLKGTGCPAVTTHGFGFSAIRRVYGSVQLDNRKNGELFLQLVCDKSELDYSDASFKAARNLDAYKLRSATLELASHCKNAAILPKLVNNVWTFSDEDRELVMGLLLHYEVEIPPNPQTQEPLCTPDELVELAVQVVAKSVPLPDQKLATVSFDDMLYLVCALNLGLGTYDLCLIDEAQDLAPIQIKMLEKLAKN